MSVLKVKNGNQWVDIPTIKGDPGQDGADGFSPVATVSKSGKIATITITDKNGTTTAQISDGEDGIVVTNVSGATPVITAEANTRYICGEVTSLSFTPCSSGICDIQFTSGLTAATLTLPSTVKTPDWFDASALETNTIYEINVLDGIYGVVAKWAL